MILFEGYLLGEKSSYDDKKYIMQIIDLSSWHLRN